MKSMIRREGLGARARAAVFVFCEGLVYFVISTVPLGILKLQNRIEIYKFVCHRHRDDVLRHTQR